MPCPRLDCSLGPPYPERANPAFTDPLEISSFTHPRLIARKRGYVIYAFSYRTVNHPPRPGTTTLVSPGTTLAFSHSAWRCKASSSTTWLTCRDTNDQSTSIETVIPSKRLVELATTSKPILMSGNGGPMTPYLYWINS
jgi:hypothetical protein